MQRKIQTGQCSISQSSLTRKIAGQSNDTRNAPLGKNGIVASDHSLSLAIVIEGDSWEWEMGMVKGEESWGNWKEKPGEVFLEQIRVSHRTPEHERSGYETGRGSIGSVARFRRNCERESVSALQSIHGNREMLTTTGNVALSFSERSKERVTRIYHPARLDGSRQEIIFKLTHCKVLIASLWCRSRQRTRVTGIAAVKSINERSLSLWGGRRKESPWCGERHGRGEWERSSRVVWSGLYSAESVSAEVEEKSRST